MLHGWVLIVTTLATCELICSQPTGQQPPNQQPQNQGPPDQPSPSQKRNESELVLWTSPAATEWMTILANKYLSDGVDRRITSIRVEESTDPTYLQSSLDIDQIDLHVYAVNPLSLHDFPSDQAILPVALSPVAIAVNLPNITSLFLSADTILAIFNGTCHSWDHSLIQRDNPSLILPSEPITIVKRGDAAASTDALISFFIESGSYWAQRYGNSMPSLPNDVLLSGLHGVVNETLQRQYSLTYSILSAFSSTTLTVIQFKNQYGLIVPADDALDVKDFNDPNHIPVLIEKSSCHFPIAIAFIIQMPKSSFDVNTAVRRSRFLLWIIERFLTETDNVCEEYDLTPMIRANRDMLMLDSVVSQGQRVLQMVLDTRSCMVGQQRLQTSSPIFYIDILNRVLPSSRSQYTDTTCLPCPPGSYNIDPFASECFPCPEQAICPGGQHLYVPQGTWASVYAAPNKSVSVWVIACEQDLQSCCPDGQCLVNPSPGSTTTCSDYFTGPGCSRCISGYMPWLRTCYSCDLSRSEIAGQILGLIVAFVFMSLVAMLVPQMSEMVYIETFLFHLQISIRLLQKMSLWSKIHRTWARDILINLAGGRIFDDLSLFMFPALSCPFQDNLIMAELFTLMLAMIYFATPTVLITVVGPFWLRSRRKSAFGEKSNSSAEIGSFVDPDRDRAFLRTLRLNGTFRLMTLVMTPLLYRSVSALNCIENPVDGSRVLSTALSEQCWTASHRQFYSLGCCIIFMLVVVSPYLLNREMSKPEHVLNAHDPAYNLMSHIKKRYRVYRPAIVAIDHILEKFLVVCVLVFGSSDPYALTFTFGLFLLIRISFTFYARHSDNVLRLLSLISLTSITMISLSNGFQSDSYYTTLMCIMLVILCPIICLGMGIGEYSSRRKLQHKIVPVIKRHLATYSSGRVSIRRTKNFSIVTNSSAAKTYPTHG